MSMPHLPEDAMSAPPEHAHGASIRRDHPVLELIADRAASGSQPGSRPDADKSTLALVVEGGGMRGVVSGGMVTALHQLGLRNAFDLVVGTSAGALAGAYFLAGQPALGTSIYYEDLIGSEWVDYKRALRRQPPVGLDYLLDEVMVTTKPLDSEVILTSKIPLYAVAARVGDFAPVVLGPFTTRSVLFEALRATARIPVASGRPVAVEGETYLDGSIADSIPFTAALSSELGATHVLCLLTRPRGQLRGRPTSLQKRLVFPLMNHIVPGLGDAYGQRAARYAREIDELERLRTDGAAYTIQLMPEAPIVGQLEQDPLKLFAGAALGAATVYESVTGERKRFFAGLTPVD
jgi:predicted patatin/cPLA2 family phospholipase